MRTLLLKFSGPLQSWGTSSHFETRHTDYYPSKSAVIGMIAAAFGYRRNDKHASEIKELNTLDFAVRIDQKGNLHSDYHIAQKYKPTGDFARSYVTQRYYMEDAIYLVGLGSSSDNLIENIEKALRSPYFSLSLGRRALIPCADLIIGSTANSVIDALCHYEWLAKPWYKNKIKRLNTCAASDKTLPLYADADLLSAETALVNRASIKRLRQDYVVSFSNKERKFGYRYEARIDIPISTLHASENGQHPAQSNVCNSIVSHVDTQHDAFAGLE